MAMKVIVLAATKGGVGKSTLACALAVAAHEEGLKVGIIDADPQGSTRDWHALRKSPAWPALLEGDTIADMLATARAQDIEWVFVDTPPALVSIIEPAIRQADLVVVPCRPSPLDILAIDPVVGLCEVHDTPFVFVLNQVPPRTTFAEDAGKQLRKAGRVLKEAVGARHGFATAMITGKTAPETERADGKAREEIDAVWQAIKRLTKAGK